MSELGWTTYESSMPSAQQQGPPAPQVTSRSEQYSPEMLERMLQPGSGGSIPAGQEKPAVAPAVASESDSKKDISNYKNVSDLWYIFIAVLAIDVFVIFLTRFYPEVFGRSLNRWYDLFGLNAVLADVLIIVLGFFIARYIYTWWVAPKVGGWNQWIFTGVLVATQLVHDVLFYIGVINTVPKGHNLMMDVFKDYAASGGAKILVGDALMMAGSGFLAMTLKTWPTHIVAGFGTLVAYALPYILYTRNIFTVLR